MSVCLCAGYITTVESVRVESLNFDQASDRFTGLRAGVQVLTMKY
jgi:hypothetical protein